MAYPLSDLGSIDKFKNEFIRVCDEHLRDGRAKAFCFIFDDPKKKTLRTSGIARSSDAVLQINKSSGSDLTTFYIDAGALSAREYGEKVIEFNRNLIDKLGGFEKEIYFPCLIFFKIKKNDDGKSYVCDIECAELTRPPGFLFSDMRDAIQRYIEKLHSNTADINGDEGGRSNYFFKIVKAGLAEVPLEMFKGVVGHLTTAFIF